MLQRYSHWGDSKIAEWVGVTHPFVKKVRRHLRREVSRGNNDHVTPDAPPQPEKREGKDGKAYPRPARRLVLRGRPSQRGWCCWAMPRNQYAHA